MRKDRYKDIYPGGALEPRKTRSPPHPEQQPLEIGCVYPDVWGRPHTILGHARTLFGSKEDPAKVYSTSHHFDVKTGLSEGHGRVLNLPRETELQVFRDFLAEVLANNPEDKLKLAREGLHYMRYHIAELENPRWKRRRTPPPGLEHP